MVADALVRFEPRSALDLDLTLAPIGSGPSLRHYDGAIWRATRTPDGPATLRLGQRNGSGEAHAWGPGAGGAGEHAPALCGEEGDDSGFKIGRASCRGREEIS